MTNKMHQFFSAELYPGLHWEAHDAAPDPLDGWSGGYSYQSGGREEDNPPHTLPTDAYGVSTLAPASTSTLITGYGTLCTISADYLYR